MTVHFRHDREGAIALQGAAHKRRGHGEILRSSTYSQWEHVAARLAYEKIPGGTREAGCCRLVMDSVIGEQQTESASSLLLLCM